MKGRGSDLFAISRQLVRLGRNIDARPAELRGEVGEPNQLGFLDVS